MSARSPLKLNSQPPVHFDTSGLSALLASSGVGEQGRTLMSNAVPLGRLGTPDEVDKAVVFLASDDANYITGTELFIDGGYAQI